MIEYVVHLLLFRIWLVSWIAPPYPTMLFLADELVAIRTPTVCLALLKALAMSALILACSLGVHGSNAYSSTGSSLSVAAFWCMLAIFCIGDMNLVQLFVLIFVRGFVSGNV